MKNLFIIRHGKATHELMPDIKRHLKEKGIKRTRKHANVLQEKNILPDLIVSSPAVRAFQTAKILKEVLNYPDEVTIDQYFYFYPLEDVINQIKKFPDDKQNIFIVGHNPVWTDIADRFTENGLWHLRTSGIAGIQFDTDTWKDFDKVPRKDKIIIN